MISIGIVSLMVLALGEEIPLHCSAIVELLVVSVNQSKSRFHFEFEFDERCDAHMILKLEARSSICEDSIRGECRVVLN